MHVKLRSSWWTSRLALFLIGSVGLVLYAAGWKAAVSEVSMMTAVQVGPGIASTTLQDTRSPTIPIPRIPSYSPSSITIPSVSVPLMSTSSSSRSTYSRQLELALYHLSNGTFIQSTITHQDTTKPWLTWIPFHPYYASLYSTFGSDAAITSCLANKRILFIGTSYQRIMFWELLKTFDPNLIYEPLNKYVSHNEFYWRKCPPHNPLAMEPPPPFTPHENGWMPKFINRTVTTASPLCYWVRNDTWCQYQHGLPGFDNVTCGLPMRRRVRVGHDTLVSFTMKTYLATPIVDEIIRKEVDAESWDLIVTSGGEWGKHRDLSPQKYKDMTHVDAVNEFLDTIGVGKSKTSAETALGAVQIHRCQSHNFKTSTKVLCNEATSSRRGLVGFHDRIMMSSLRQFDRMFRKEHGFEGPLVEASMRVIMTAVCTPVNKL